MIGISKYLYDSVTSLTCSDPQSQLCSVYYALVESHLRYGDVIWGSLCKTKLAALERL